MSQWEFNFFFEEFKSFVVHCGKLRPYSTGGVWRGALSGLEGFGNFGHLHYHIKDGGHLPYEGETEPGLVCLNLDT